MSGKAEGQRSSLAGTRGSAGWSAAHVFVATLWLGLILGVSFLATPVKFQAQSLDLPTALEVGRVTFGLFSPVEIGLCLILVVVTVFSGARPLRWAGLIVLAALVALQAVWLLPELDARVGRIMAGDALEASNHHLFFTAADSIKAVALLLLSVGGLIGLSRGKGVRSRGDSEINEGS